MDVEKLVRMANDIGRLFQAEPDHQTGVDGVASHLKRFWDPRMRREIITHVKGGGAGLIDIAREAVLKLEKK